jgi:hypothetical protein
VSIVQVIDQLKADGYQVFGPEKLTSYVWFTDDGERIGSVQHNNVMGAQYGSVHQPDKHVGSGFEASSAKEALLHAPHWVNASDRRFVRKWQSVEQFRKQHWQKLVDY